MKKTEKKEETKDKGSKPKLDKKGKPIIEEPEEPKVVIPPPEKESNIIDKLRKLI